MTMEKFWSESPIAQDRAIHHGINAQAIHYAADYRTRNHEAEKSIRGVIDAGGN